MVTSSGSLWKYLEHFTSPSQSGFNNYHQGEDGPPEEYTILELLLALLSQGWEHHVVKAFKPNVGDAYEPGTGVKKFYTETVPTGTTLRWYFLALTNADRIFQNGVSLGLG